MQLKTIFEKTFKFIPNVPMSLIAVFFKIGIGGYLSIG